MNRYPPQDKALNSAGLRLRWRVYSSKVVNTCSEMPVRDNHFTRFV
jgi:hypothetical protein